MDPTYDTEKGSLSFDIICLICAKGPRSNATLTKTRILPTSKRSAVNFYALLSSFCFLTSKGGCKFAHKQWQKKERL
jgi:hypothetical protein